MSGVLLQHGSGQRCAFYPSPQIHSVSPLAASAVVTQLMKGFSFFRLADSQRCLSQCSRTLSPVKKKKQKKKSAGEEVSTFKLLRYSQSVAPPLRADSRLSRNANTPPGKDPLYEGLGYLPSVLGFGCVCVTLFMTNADVVLGMRKASPCELDCFFNSLSVDGRSKKDG